MLLRCAAVVCERSGLFFRVVGNSVLRTGKYGVSRSRCLLTGSGFDFSMPALSPDRIFGPSKRAFRKHSGEVAEWPNAPVLKTGVGSNLPWVQIPPSPLMEKDSRRIDVSPFFVRKRNQQQHQDTLLGSSQPESRCRLLSMFKWDNIALSCSLLTAPLQSKGLLGSVGSLM